MRQLVSVWSLADWVYEQAESFQELPILIRGMPESFHDLSESVCCVSMLIFGLMQAMWAGSTTVHETRFCLGHRPGAFA